MRHSAGTDGPRRWRLREHALRDRDHAHAEGGGVGIGAPYGGTSGAGRRALDLSWWVIEGVDRRDGQGRLYASFNTVKAVLEGYAIEQDGRIISASSGKVVHRLVARRRDGD